MAGKIMHMFSGYTVENLLNEPLNIFFALGRMADRVQADDALECVYRGVNSITDSESLKKLLILRGEIETVEKTPADAATMATAMETARKIAEGRQKLTIQHSFKINDLKKEVSNNV